MRAIRVHEYGGPEALRLEDAPAPETGPGLARVKLDAIGVNFIEIYQRSGAYTGRLPFIPGTEAAGVVDAVGPDVTVVKPGDRVATTNFAGTYAEYALAPADRLIPIPAGISTEVAAAAMLQGMTAHYLTFSTYPLNPGQTALIHAAGGGLGQLLVQIAKRLGARVIGTAGSEEKLALAREAGADEVVNYTEQDFAAEARRLTNGAGVDVVYDSVGKSTFDKSLDSLRPRGYLVLLGQSSGAVPPFDPQTLNAKGSLFLTRPTLVHYIATRDELLWRANDVLTWILNGELKVRIDQTFPLAEAGAAHEYLAGRKTRGKVLLLP